MYQLLILVGPDIGYTETAETLGKARKLRNFIFKNGYEMMKPEGIVSYPPHRIERIDIAEMPEIKVVHTAKDGSAGKKEEEKSD